MLASNTKARRWLERGGYRDIQMFPHSRFSKDVVLDNLKFDGIAISDNSIAFFQVKTNCRQTKEMQELFKSFSEKYHVKAYWINGVDGSMEPEIW